MEKYLEFVLRKSKKPIDLERIYSKIEELLSEENNSFYSLSKKEEEKIQELVKKGLEEYKYIKTATEKISLINKTSFRTGKFYGNRNGEGFVISKISYTDKEGNHVVREEKNIITKDNSNNAIDGDTVLIDTGGKGQRAKVEKIISRNLDNIIGEITRIGNSYFLKPVDKKKKSLNILLEGEQIEGQKVAVKLKEQTSDNFYIGEVTRVFNHKDDPDEEILWEAFKCGIDYEFSEDALKQLEFIPKKVLDKDKIGRENLTEIKTFTIDGVDTKDMDDALSCIKLPNGNYEVGVHIAHVSHYIPKNSPLDKEAYKRGNSNYLANKVIPMFPHEISNGICSLNPNVERLTLSCIMEMNNKGELIRYRISPTVIKSNLKMSYGKVNELLKEGKYDDTYKAYKEELMALNKLALTLRKNRILNGAIEFDKPELKLIYDDNNELVDFSLRHQDVAENLIEEFMVLANETVDKHLTKNNCPCLHRIHDKPNEEKLTEYLNLLAAINLPFNHDAKELVEDPYLFQKLTMHIKQAGSMEPVLVNGLIRCVSRANYSPKNIGHNGLSKDAYCHFTSPIRRYADLTIERIIDDMLLKMDKRTITNWKLELPDIGMQTSRMERVADEAERQVKYMECSGYMEKRIGNEYKGTITGISDRAIQIQLDNMIEGKVKIDDLRGNYTYNPITYTLLSMDNKEDYYLGDRLLVSVKAASKSNKTIDFEILEKIDENTIDDVNRSNIHAKYKAKRKLYDNYGRT